jgi:hypothetical protein
MLGTTYSVAGESELLQILDESRRDGMDIGEKKYVTTFKGANMRGRRLADLGVCDRKMLK